jgi:hypothetical protein
MRRDRPGDTAERPSEWMQAWLADRAWSRALRHFWIAILGSPAVAWLWASTAARVRLFEEGLLDPRQGADYPWWILYDGFWIGIHHRLGMAPLHAAFGLLLASTVALGIRGYLQVRIIGRGPDFAGARRHSRERLVRMEQELLANPAFRDRVEATRREGPGGWRGAPSELHSGSHRSPPPCSPHTSSTSPCAPDAMPTCDRAPPAHRRRRAVRSATPAALAIRARCFTASR